jgi:Protein of unknown function (DUF3093)
VTRYTPSRYYFIASIIAMTAAVQCSWVGFHWSAAWIPAVLFASLAGALVALSRRPAIEIHPHYLRVGSRSIDWSDIQAVDRAGWFVPLLVFLTLTNGRRVMLIYAGDPDSSRALLRHLRRFAREALIDGLPHEDYWSDPQPVTQDNLIEPERSIVVPAPRYPLLREEDEAEVERLYQRLKSVGHLDPKPGTDE